MAFQPDGVMPELVSSEWEPAWGSRLSACRTERFNPEGDKGASMQREAVPQDVSMAGSALANRNTTRLGIDLGPWQEAQAEDLSRSRDESGAAVATPEVNR